MTDAAVLARKGYKTVEPLHTAAYFAAEMAPAYAAAGAKGTMRAYFAVRSAPMGQAAPEVVVVPKTRTQIVRTANSRGTS